MFYDAVKGLFASLHFSKVLNCVYNRVCDKEMTCIHPFTIDGYNR